MDIKRTPGDARGRSRSVEHGGLVYTVATAAGATLREQTAATLAQIDRNLTEAGSNRSRLLSATVYLTDIAGKAEMDEVWNAWIGPDNWPQRACVQAGLAGSDLVEITVIAAK